MKKHALKWLALIGATLVAFSFASCKQDDDDDDNTPATYTVSIATTIEHGTVTANATTGVLAGTTVKLTATPDDGYELESFSVTDANTNAITVTGGTFTMPASNVTVSATFKAKTTEQTPATDPDTPSGTTYTVTFNTNGGSEVAFQSVASGKTATAPSSPTKDGYVFKGWYTSSDNGTTLSDTAFDFATAITQNTTLYAKWEVLPPNSYTVTFDSNGGSEVESLVVTGGEKATEPTSPTKTGYTFAGWYNGETAYDFSTAVTADITLTAKWTAIVYTMTYELNDGAWAADYTATASYTVEDEISLPDAEKLTRTGYGFGGWYETSELTGEAISKITVGTTGNKSFYAKWTEGAVNYTVKHYQQNLADDDYTLVESETKTGTTGAQTEATTKTYEGFTAPESISQATISADGSTTVEIRYTRNTYTVTFNADGGSAVTEQSVKHGGKATEPTSPTKTGYTFVAWYNGETTYDFSAAVTANITLTAHWNAIAVTSVSITNAPTELTVGGTGTLTATVSPDDALNKTVTWESSNGDVLTINASTGAYEAKAEGTATITAKAGDKTATCTVSVKIAVTSIAIDNAPTEALFVNSTGTLTATVSPDNATDKTVVWSSSDPDYVTINAETGEYTIMGTKGYGSATITATAGDKTATCTITGKVTYTSLSAGTILHVGDTFYAGNVYFNTSPLVSFQDSNGAITVVENNGYYTFQRGSNGTKPNLTAYKVKDNTDGIYIVSGSGTSTSDRFVLAVHTVQ